MQVLCGLQVVFFLFNCQTPVYSFWAAGKISEGKARLEGFPVDKTYFNAIMNFRRNPGKEEDSGQNNHTE